MVRHFIVAGPISAAARGVCETALSACLIPLGDISPPLGSGHASAIGGAINLSAVTTSADQNLRPATFAKKETSSALFFSSMATAMTWTWGASCAITARHSCSARCRARRRVELAVRSALCLPSSIYAKITARAAAAPVLTVSVSPDNRQGYRYTSAATLTLIRPRGYPFA